MASSRSRHLPRDSDPHLYGFRPCHCRVFRRRPAALALSRRARAANGAQGVAPHHDAALDFGARPRHGVDPRPRVERPGQRGAGRCGDRRVPARARLQPLQRDRHHGPCAAALHGPAADRRAPPGSAQPALGRRLARGWAVDGLAADIPAAGPNGHVGGKSFSSSLRARATTSRPRSSAAAPTR